jgi:hypothetical protein
MLTPHFVIALQLYYLTVKIFAVVEHCCFTSMWHIQQFALLNLLLRNFVFSVWCSGQDGITNAPMKIGEVLLNCAAESKHFCLFKSKTIANIHSFCNHFNMSLYVMHSLWYQWQITSPFSVCHIDVARSSFHHHQYVPSRAIFFFEQWSWTVATAI